jgi:hypothetical protein
MPVRPSVRTYQRGSHRTNFREIYYCVILRKYVEKLHFFLFLQLGKVSCTAYEEQSTFIKC